MNTKPKHAPEPWKTFGMLVYSDPTDSSDVSKSVLVAATYCTVDGEPRTFDADRISACVTACAGIPDPKQAIEAARKALANVLIDAEHGTTAVQEVRKALALLSL